MIITVLAADPSSETLWAQRLQETAQGWVEVQLRLASGSSYGPIVFVDSLMPDLEAVLARIDRKGRAVFLLANASSNAAAIGAQARLAAMIQSGQADDVLLYPFRPLELLARFRHYQQILMWNEVQQLNTSFSEVVGRLKEDLELAARLQKSQAPIRFSDVKGFKAISRYLAGMKSGGDYFDLAESPSGNQLSIVLSDSSSYGLSSAVLSVLMRVAMKLSAEDARSCEETVQRIRQEILATLHERDRLSLFYGVISRKDYVLRYLNLGSGSAFYAPPKRSFAALATQGEPITRKMLSGPARGTGAELALEPEGRLAFISDGFVEASGGSPQMVELLNQFRERELGDTVNELVFRVKSKFTPENDMPAQDCTAVILDVDARVLRQI
jgi:hypothetical protein